MIKFRFIGATSFVGYLSHRCLSRVTVRRLFRMFCLEVLLQPVEDHVVYDGGCSDKHEGETGEPQAAGD